MQELLALIVKYGTHLAFLLMEIFCFYLIISYNDVQRSIFLNSTSLYTAKINKQADRIGTYLDLQKVNDSLQQENKMLLEQIIQSRIVTHDDRAVREEGDSTLQYRLIPVTICNQTSHLRNNTLTLCQGRVDGVEPMMGVTSADGIIGIVKEVSDHYASVISVLHSQSRISCQVKGKYSFGNLIWKSKDPRRAALTGVPRHTSLSVGDTVLTSGYSAIFPAGLMVGVVESFSIPRGSNEYSIVVHLSHDATTAAYGYVIQNALREEQLEVEDES